MNSKSNLQYQNLVGGFESMISKKYARLFSPSELKSVIYGDNHTFMISDLKPYVVYENGNRKLIQYFWQVLEEFTPKERNDFLFYVTSSHRPPIGGFQYLNPALRVKFSDSLPRTSLPEAGTCFNTLYVPNSYSLNDMREKIKTAISLNDGFFFA